MSVLSFVKKLSSGICIQAQHFKSKNVIVVSQDITCTWAYHTEPDPDEESIL